jgi:hypothetical protein
VFSVRCGGTFEHKTAFAAARSAVYKMNQEHTSRFLERKLGKELPSSDFLLLLRWKTCSYRKNWLPFGLCQIERK